MRVLVCGGRDYNDAAKVEDTLNLIHESTPISVVIQGEAKGADRLGKLWARGKCIETLGCPANWDMYGKSAGYIRNSYMLSMNPDLVVAFKGGKGTANMVALSKKAGVRVIEVE